MQVLIDKLKDYPSVYLVYDLKVEYLADQIDGACNISARLGIDAGERNKTVDAAVDICSFLLAMGADRDSLVLALGGGTTCDVVGFSASIYKRGIRCAFLPTTLLSMVDAAYGGKTGVNLESYKNIIGTFHQPEFVMPMYDALKTLPKREYLSGVAEMLKTFLIEGGSFYEEAVNAISSGEKDLTRFISEAASFKMQIVSRDPFEKGERRKLNLGHTFAHAIEWYEHTHKTKRPLTHGEAVAVGIIKAARLTDEALASRLEEDFRSCGLPTEVEYSMDDLLPAMEKDKKNSDGQIRFVLIYSIGEVE